MNIMKQDGLPHPDACTSEANLPVCASFLIRVYIYLLPRLLLIRDRNRIKLVLSFHEQRGLVE